MFFGFLKRVLIARFYTPGDYGYFNLYMTVLAIFATFGAFGLRSGIQRNISYYLGKDEEKKVSSIIGWGLSISIIVGIGSGAILYLFSPYIAPFFSDNPDLVYYFRLAGLAVPFSVLVTVLTSVFRGFQRTKEKIIFHRLGQSTLLLAFIIIIGGLAYSFDTIIIGAFASTAITSIFFIFYYFKIVKTELNLEKKLGFQKGLGKKLILFSLPLVLVDMMMRVMGWADTILIGYFSTEEAVGFYNAARPLTSFISIGLSVTLFIYSPLAAKFYAQEKFKENEVIYSALTKWICFLTLPIALVLIIFPEVVIKTSFGGDYLPGMIPLQILAIAYFVNNLMGPNGATLTAYGKTKFLMYATSGAAALNVLLNMLLIPIYGIIGAAAATGLSLIGMNTIRVLKLNKLAGIHSLKSNTLKPISTTATICLMSGIAIKRIIPINLYIVGGFFIGFFVIFFLSMILTRSISNEDIKVLLLVEKKLGIDLSKIKTLLKKFI